MKLVYFQKRINELMSRFVSQIKGEAAMSKTDLNKVAETILIPLFNEIFGWNLCNINYVENNSNYPGIDLADQSAGIAVQITATSRLEKVKHTLHQFIAHNQYSSHRKLIIYILTEKQKNYSQDVVNAIIQNKFIFDTQKHIWDYRDILREISSFQIDKATKVQSILEANFGEGKRFLGDTEHRINWRTICRDMLDRQKLLSTNSVIASEAMQFDLLSDGIFVSPALVERKEPDRLSSNLHPARSIEHFEEKPAIQYEQFRDEILRHETNDRIAIIGEPGAGKTTLLQDIAFWILREELGLPIWISVGALVKSDHLQRIKTYLTEIWLEDAFPTVTQDISLDFWEQWNKQPTWLLLDGIDEVVSTSGFTLDEINQQIRKLVSQARIILTCRLNIWDAEINALREFKTYRTKEFDYPKQVNQFIENGFCKTNPRLGEWLKRELSHSNHARLQQLVKNPLQLMMLCATWHEEQCLPETKAELYQRFTQEFYKWNKAKWKKRFSNYEFFPTTAAKRESLNQALGQLACCALAEETSSFRLSYNLVFHKLGDPEEEGSNFWLALNLGWLQVARNSERYSERVYTFFHPTFQEYFAAFSICISYDNTYFINMKLGAYKVFDKKWIEVVYLWLGMKRDEDFNSIKSAFIEDIINFGERCEELYKYQAFYLAALLLGELKSDYWSNIILSQHLHWLIEDSSHAVQEISYLAFQRTNKKYAVQFLSAALDSLFLDGKDLHAIYKILVCLWEIDPENFRAASICRDLLLAEAEPRGYIFFIIDSFNVLKRDKENRILRNLAKCFPSDSQGMQLSDEKGNYVVIKPRSFRILPKEELSNSEIRNLKQAEEFKFGHAMEELDKLINYFAGELEYGYSNSRTSFEKIFKAVSTLSQLAKHVKTDSDLNYILKILYRSCEESLNLQTIGNKSFIQYSSDNSWHRLLYQSVFMLGFYVGRNSRSDKDVISALLYVRKEIEIEEIKKIVNSSLIHCIRGIDYLDFKEVWNHSLGTS